MGAAVQATDGKLGTESARVDPPQQGHPRGHRATGSNRYAARSGKPIIFGTTNISIRASTIKQPNDKGAGRAVSGDRRGEEQNTGQ